MATEVPKNEEISGGKKESALSKNSKLGKHKH